MPSSSTDPSPPDPDEPSDERWVDVGAFIRDQRRKGQLSLRKLSEMAGVSNPYLSQIERGLRRPSADILQQIARALEISAETLYVQAGILDEPRPGRDLVAEIRRDPYLTEEQRTTLVRIYESFTAGRRPSPGEGPPEPPDAPGPPAPSDPPVAAPVGAATPDHGPDGAAVESSGDG